MDFEKYKAFPTFDNDDVIQNDKSQNNNGNITTWLPLVKLIIYFLSNGKRSAPSQSTTRYTPSQNNKAYYDFVKRHNDAVRQAQKNNK